MLPEPVCLLALGAAWLVFVAISVGLCGAGFLHPESYSFLPHYLSGRPLLELVYDNHVTDWGNYQARELAFVFDWLDCQFIAGSVSRGHPHFFSATHYLFLLLAGLALWWIATRYFALSRAVAFGLVLLLWTGPSAALYTSFYRSAKTSLLLATLLTVWAWLAARDASAPPALRRCRLVIFGLSAAAMPLLDKQGLLFLGALTLLLACLAWKRRDAQTTRLLIVGLLALAFAWSYQRFLGPGITRYLHGYEVDRDYTAIPFSELTQNLRLLATTALGAPIMAFDWFRFPLGNLPTGLALIALWWLWRQFREEGRWLFAGLCVFICVVFAAMLSLFPLMLSSEHRRFFYGEPITALWLLGAMAALAEFLRRSPGRTRWVATVVFALVLSNAIALQEHRFVLRQGKYRPSVENAARVREALRPAAIQASGLTPERAAALLNDAPYFRDAVPPSLAEDRIYLALFSRAAGQPVPGLGKR